MLQPRAKFQRISPVQARQWLETSLHNRPLRQATVDRYAKDILENRWHNNGETIKFNGKGQLIDGQHRLSAVVQAGKGIPALVVHNLALECIDTVDTGRMRSLANQLAMEGETYYCELSTAIRNLHLLIQNPIPLTDRKETFTNLQGLAFLETHPKLRDYMKWIMHDDRLAMRGVYSPGAAAGMMYVCSMRSPKIARSFFHKLASGENVSGVVLKLRNKLLADRRAAIRARNDIRLWWIISAWNALRAGRTISNFSNGPRTGQLVLIK
jgi:hypothetical protein